VYQSADLGSMQARAQIVLREDIWNIDPVATLVNIACSRSLRFSSAGSNLIVAEVKSAPETWRSDPLETPGTWEKIPDRSAYMGASQVDIGGGFSRRVGCMMSAPRIERVTRPEF
jgi:hypothetical protein